MFAVLISFTIILLLVLGTEYLWRIKKISTEYSRKFVHISVASFVAFWPLFMSWRTIEISTSFLLAVVVISRIVSFPKSIHNIDRRTWGAQLSSLSTVILAFFFHTDWIFAAAMLHLGLADGFAAVVGTKSNMLKYKVFGHQKSVPGSSAFFIFSLIIILTVAIWWGDASWTVLIWLPLLSTLIENIAIYGSDDIFVPIIVAIALRWL